MQNRPNVILITLHDIGRHLSVYDSDLPETASLSRIAEEGVVFDNHFSTCPLCSPARSSIQTGRYPHSNGMNGLTHRGFCLNKDEKCVPLYLNDLGYRTALFGYQHETHDDVAFLGYSDVYFGDDYSANIADVVPNVVEYLKGKKDDSPFYISIGTWEVHRSFKASGEKPIELKDVKVPPYLKNCPEVREDLADFYGILQGVDKAIGQLLDGLDDLGLSDNTLLVFTNDHGAAFPRAKSTLYDPGIGVSMLARWPGVIKAGSRIKQLTSHVDYLPTILDICGAEIPEKVHGQSFLHLLKDEQGDDREYIFSEKSWHGNEYDPMRCVRSNEWKYIRNFTEGYLYQTPLDIKMGLSGQVMEESRKQERPMAELYNLLDDPDEVNNLAGNEDFKEIELEFEALLNN